MSLREKQKWPINYEKPRLHIKRIETEVEGN